MNDYGITAFLGRGAENAVSTAELVSLTGCSSARHLQALIAAERENGELILSSTRGGYYLPADGPQGREEILAFKRTLYARAIKTIHAARAAKRALEVLDGQEAM